VQGGAASVAQEAAVLLRGPVSLSARQRAAAARIQRAFRAFRRRFPEGGRLFSRSSTSPAVYQEGPEFRNALAAALEDQLVALAGMAPAVREAHVAAGRARLGLGPELPPGFVRAELLANGQVGFADAAWVAAWAQLGYLQAKRRVGRRRLRELPLDQVNFALGYVQAEAAAVAAVSENLARVRMMRSVAEPRSPGTFRRGMQPKRRYLAAGEGGRAEAIVGAPGDRFRLSRDMRLFLADALGGMQRYRWAMNPRRRRRVRGRPPRWIMNVNFGVRHEELYRWLRLMYGRHKSMSAARNWSHLYARPLDVYDPTGPPGRNLKRSVRDLLRRFLLDAMRSDASTRSRYMSLSRTEPERPTAPQQRTWLSVTPHAAGMLTGGDADGELHAGVFLAAVTPDTAGEAGRERLTVAVMDPQGAPSFSQRDLRTLRAAFREALRAAGLADRITLEVGVLDLGKALAVQQSYEGSCSPSSVALLMSLLRELRTLGAGTRTRLSDADTRDAAPALLGSLDGMADVALRAFWHVNDEDVVMASQLSHNFAARPGR
jgi:hypothetical protein